MKKLTKANLFVLTALLMKLNPAVLNILDYDFTDFTLENYNPHPIIKAPIAVWNQRSH